MDDQDDRAFLESAPTLDGLDRMAQSLGGGRPVLIDRLVGGLDASTHRFELSGRRLVLKRARPGTDRLRAEFENLHYAARSAVPTPKPVAEDLDGDWFGVPAIVMSEVPGRVNAQPDDLKEWLGGLAWALAAIHDTDAHDLPVRRPPRRERFDMDDTLFGPRADAIRTAIDSISIASGSDPWLFTHDDFHPGNSLFDGDRLVGVVDWAGATNEPRASAVSYCRKDLAIHPGGSAPDQFLAAYESEIGARVEHLAAWDVLQGARAIQWGHRWPPAFAEIGIHMTALTIRRASEHFVDNATPDIG